jgi:hypothetical protein
MLLVTLLFLLVNLVGCAHDKEPPLLNDSSNGYAEQIESIPTEAPPSEKTSEDQEVDNTKSTEWALHWPMITSHGQMALSYIEYINDNFYERLPFSYREKETALWIIDELYSMGYDRDDIELQTFHRTDIEQWLTQPWEGLMWGMFDIEGFLRMHSQNVILTIPGQSEYTLIVGAHYDCLIWPGGNDNASGTALLLESAYAMLEHDSYYTIVYIFFGAEELGCLGARYYYDSMSEQQRDNIVLMINADALLSGDLLMYGTGQLHTDMIMENNISQQIYAISKNLYNTHGMDTTSHLNVLEWGSDHRVFLENNHTVIHLLSVQLIPEQGTAHPILGSYGNEYITWRSWHTNEDCIHFINEAWPSLVEVNMWSFSLFLEAVLLTTFDN